jgi:hypothetical protein
MSQSVRCPRAAPRFGDDLIDLYVHWREECIAVRAAYTWWSDAQTDERATAFAVYRAALDREEQASRVYADLISRVAADAPAPA